MSLPDTRTASPSNLEEDRQSVTTTRSSLRENGNMDDTMAAEDETNEPDTSFETRGETSLPMSRSASESSTSSTVSSSADDEKLLVKTVAPEKRVSIYVQVFEEMLNTVLEYESHLFNEEELEMLARFKTMSYPARYLFVRLFSRKNGWFRVSKIGYHDELVDVQAAVDEICETAAPLSDGITSTLDERQEPEAGPSGISGNVVPSSSQHEEVEDSGVILIDSDDEDPKPGKGKAMSLAKSKTVAKLEDAKDPLSNRPVKEVKKEIQDFGLTRFAINERILAERNDVDELLSLLSLDELKALGKELRIPSNFTTRPTIMEAIRRTSSSQSTLTSMFAAAAAKTKAKAESMLGLGGGKSSKAEGKEKAKAASLAPSRQTEVLTYKILQHLGRCIKLESGPIRLFARLHLLYYRSISFSEKTLTQAVLARFKIRNYPSYTVKRSFSIFEDRKALVDYEDALILERRIEELTGEAPDSTIAGRFRKGTKEQREKDMREALAIFEDVYPRWKEMVAVAKLKDEQEKKEREEQGIEDDKLTYYRKRFLAGWPLTRVVYKGATILARLHEYAREAEVMVSLLEQSCFRRGKRGEWYDRLALLYMHHHSRLDQENGMDKIQYQEKALKICYEGLNHPWSHLIYHNSLARRIVRLETALDVPKEDRHPPVPSLRQALKRVMKGEKLSEGETGRKSIWRAQDGSEVSVEDLCLEQYKREGWKGFHSENGICTTIFALLFWDVIFAPIDGVFETAYQAGPLDLSTDAFAIVRAELVEARLKEIEDGHALEILSAADERERANKTYCVGLKWYYEREDLLEIVQCFSPQALKTVCRVYAEEWSYRVGGVPDLLYARHLSACISTLTPLADSLWNFEEKRCRFVEVKGPGDFLSETQKVWIDVLLSADVRVELCAVHQIFEEDYLSFSDLDSPRKAKVSPPRKSKDSQKKEEALSTDDESDAGRKKRRKSVKLPTPKPSPPAEDKGAMIKSRKKRVSEPTEERKDSHTKTARSGSVKSDIKPGKSERANSKKRKKSGVVVSKADTSGTAIILSD